MHHAELASRDLRSDEVDIRSVIRLSWSIRWWMLGSVLVMLSLVSLWIATTEAVYRAEVLVVPASVDTRQSNFSSMLGGLDDLATRAGISAFDSNRERVQETLAILRSRDLTNAFIEDKGLRSILFADQWDSAAQQWREGTDSPSLADAYTMFDEEIRTVTERSDGVIVIAVHWRDRFLAAEWANDLVARLNEFARERAIEKASQSLEYLSAELERTTIVQLKQAIYGVMESQINQIMLANVNREYALRVIDPALVPDEDDWYWPRPALMVFAACMTGLALGFLAGLVWCAVRRAD